MTRNILAESFIEAAMNKGHNDENASKDASPSSEPPFLLVSSCGPSADHQGSLLGLYRKSEEEIREGRSVYIQEHDTQYRGSHSKLTSAQGVWRIVDEHGNVYLRAAKIIESPISSVTWEYKLNGKTWEEDLALTVTGLSEKPSECEITITLPDITEPGVAGVWGVQGRWLILPGEASAETVEGPLHTLCGLGVLDSEPWCRRCLVSHERVSPEPVSS